MSDCVVACPERSGLCTSTFWTVAGGSQIFSYMFNSVILGNFDPSLIFVITGSISVIAIIWFGWLPVPAQPKDQVKEEKTVSAMQSFKALIDLLVKEKRTL